MTKASVAGPAIDNFDGLILHLDRKLRQTGPVFWVTFCGIFLMFAIALGTSLTVANINVREIQRSQNELEGTVRLLARHFDSQLEAFEAVPKSVADLMAQKASTSDQFEALASTQAFHELLREKLSATTDFAGVNLFDADGFMLNSSEHWPIPRLSLVDRAFFQAFKSGQSSRLLSFSLWRAAFPKG